MSTETTAGPAGLAGEGFQLDGGGPLADEGRLVPAPFSGPDRDVPRRLLDDAGHGGISIRIGVPTVPFASAREPLLQEVAAPPLAALGGAMDGVDGDNLTRDVAERPRPYLDDDGVAFPMRTWLVTAGHRRR